MVKSTSAVSATGVTGSILTIVSIGSSISDCVIAAMLYPSNNWLICADKTISSPSVALIVISWSEFSV